MFSNSVSSWFVFSSQPAHQTADYSEGCIHEIAKVLAGAGTGATYWCIAAVRYVKDSGSVYMLWVSYCKEEI